MQASVSSTAAALSTTIAPEGTPQYIGFIATGVAVIFFGSNFVPLKKFNTGDGMFFQWVLCTSIWIVGLVTNAIRGFPTFWPLGMVGGLLWATGNITVVPIIKTVGLAMGLLLWSSLNLLFGWASGRFGWFGINAEVPPDTTMNYIGVSLSVMSALVFLNVKSNVEPEQTAGDKTALVSEDLLALETSLNSRRNTGEDEEGTFLANWTPVRKRVLGSCLAIVSGIFYGLNFLPVIYVKDNYAKYNLTTPGCDNPKISPHDVDYAFSHFSGIMAASTLYFIIYCIYMRNKPKLYPSAILPGMVSGTMWGIAQVSFFIANETLSEAVSFPIISTGPGVIAALWGVFVFKEIRGKRNFIILGIAISITIAGAVLCGMSKIKK